MVKVECLEKCQDDESENTYRAKSNSSVSCAIKTEIKQEDVWSNLINLHHAVEIKEEHSVPEQLHGGLHATIRSIISSPQQPHILNQVLSIGINENNIKEAENIGLAMVAMAPDILTSEIKFESKINVDIDRSIISDEGSSDLHDEVNALTNNIHTTNTEENSNTKPFSVKNVKNRKINRNSGKEYITAKGEVKLARQMKPLRQNCRNKCKDKLTENIRISIFDEYWGLGTHDRRVAFIVSLIDVEQKRVTRTKTNDRPTKNRLHSYVYHFNVNGKREVVCKTCFLNTLGETEKFLICSISNKLTSNSGVTHPDRRGYHAPVHKTSQTKIDEVVKHISSFPTYESRYLSRHTENKYLSEKLNITKMYSLYCQDNVEPVSIKIYSRQFHEMGLKFKKPKK